MREPIQVLKPYYRIDECLAEIKECLEKGWTGAGFKTLKFEEEFKKYAGLPNCHAVNSATAALHLAVKILKEQEGWVDGDEVISTPLSFVSTNHAILYENLKVVFADVHPHTLCLDPRSIESKITEKTRAVMYVGLGGRIGHLQQISDLCRKYNLRLILDAAHMAGSRFNGRHVGGEADVSCFSFQAVKNLGTSDMGAICFKDHQYDELVRKLAWLGISASTFDRTNSDGRYKWKYSIPFVGYKYNANSVVASLALVGLKYLDKDNTYRHHLSMIYDQAFNKHQKIELVDDVIGADGSRHLYQIIVPDRDEIMLKLNAKGIYCGVHYISNTEYPMYSHFKGSCPVAESVQNRLISLPLHLHLKKDDVEYVCESLLEVVK